MSACGICWALRFRSFRRRWPCSIFRHGRWCFGGRWSGFLGLRNVDSATNSPGGCAYSSATSRPINLNFFCHTPPAEIPREKPAGKPAWNPTTASWGLICRRLVRPGTAAAFDAAACEIVEEVTPEVVSFHFGLPDEISGRACQIYRLSNDFVRDNRQ